MISGLFAALMSLNSQEATFEIVSSSSSGFGLTGTLEVLNKPIFPHEAVKMERMIKNTGNTNIDNLQLRIRIVNPENQEIIDTITETKNLVIGDNLSEAINWTHTPLRPIKD